MKWFVASIISVIELEEDRASQEDYPVYEDFFLFSASSEEELQSKINKEMRLIDEAGKNGINYDGKKAIQKCLGIRKIRRIYNESLGERPPSDGTELTHSFMMVKSVDDAINLANGKAAYVHYVDDDSDF